MNFLSPRKLATQASSEMIDHLKDDILTQKKAAEQAAKTADEQAQVMQTAHIVISGKASGKGTLFKAVSEKDVAKAITAATQITVEPSQIEMEHFKKEGDYSVSVALGPRKVTVPVHVEAEA